MEHLYRAACCDKRPIVTGIPAEPSLSHLDLVLEQTVPFDRQDIAGLIVGRLKYMSWPTRLRLGLTRRGVVANALRRARQRFAIQRR